MKKKNVLRESNSVCGTNEYFKSENDLGYFDEGNGEFERKLIYCAVDKVLSRDWLSKEDEEAWKNL